MRDRTNVRNYVADTPKGADREAGPARNGQSRSRHQASCASTPPTANRSATGNLDRQSCPRRSRKEPGCDRFPNTDCCRNWGRSESGSGCRYRRHARKCFARPQASRGPSDRSRPNGRRCRFGAGKPCSGADQPTGARPRRSPGAIRNGILPFSPEASKPLIISRGTGCSNPFPSSGESRELP